jgi:hypothetical protein
MKIFPEEPPLAFPVTNAIDPLAPAEPPLAVIKNTLPLEVVIPAPDMALIAPPS